MIKIKEFNNGTILVHEKLPHLRSVCLGIWLKAGSRYETAENNGISHFLEHMLFKGTKSRSARDIADEFDGIGGILNGFTGKEATCYYGKTLDNHFEKAMDILADMVQNSLLEPEMVERERKVIFEEMAMYADSPEDYVHEMLEKDIWPGNPLGYPIIGTKDSMTNITGTMLGNYSRTHLSPCNTVISVAGSFDEDKMIDIVEKYFGTSKKGEGIKQGGFIQPVFNPGTRLYHKDVEQAYISIGFESMGYEDPSRYAMMAAGNILGGSMSSRLFQTLREDKGLVYTIGSANDTFADSGLFNIYAGTGTDEMDEAIECIRHEVCEMAENGVTEEELERTKEQIKGNLIMGMENTNTRMSYMGKHMLLRGQVETQDDIVAIIDSITRESIQEVTASVLKWDNAAISILRSE
ncbi:MAG: insulinase family protein [Clostridia bacterium]|nr:insulinase family protein [Clostridia bacterium]MBN2882112.1 insulinase family protein [Clostridia bacterium]